MVKIIVIFFLRYWGYLKPLLPKFKGNVARVKWPLALFDRLRQNMQISKPVKFSRRPGTGSQQTKFKFWTEVWFGVFHYLSDERIIEITTEMKFAKINAWPVLTVKFVLVQSLLPPRKAEDLIGFFMTAWHLCLRVGGFQNPGVCLQAFPSFLPLHSSPCNSLLPNCTETLATQARTKY